MAGGQQPVLSTKEIYEKKLNRWFFIKLIFMKDFLDLIVAIEGKMDNWYKYDKEWSKFDAYIFLMF